MAVSTMIWHTGWAVRGDILLRLLIGALLGAVIGFEREADDQAAGLRTHASVAMGAALFGIISTVGFLGIDSPRNSTNIQVDVSRVASQVVVGIGFLGAGLIFRQGGRVRNLTTAASLWVTAAIGLAAGIGSVGTAAAATGALVVVLAVLRAPKAWARHRLAKDVRRIRVTLATGEKPAGVEAALARYEDLDVRRIAHAKQDGKVVLNLTLASKRGGSLNGPMAVLVERVDVVDVVDLSWF